MNHQKSTIKINNDNNKETQINEYHASQTQPKKFFGFSGKQADFRGLGFELEFDSTIQDGQAFRSSLLNILTKNNGKDHHSVEQDSSLICGVELITQPHTVKEMKKFLKKTIKPLLSEIKTKTHAEEHDTAALHIHLSKNMFGKTKQQQIDSIAKLFCLFSNNKGFFKESGQRENWQKCTLDLGCETKIQAKTFVEMMYARTNDFKQTSRYKAINLKNKHTVEFRHTKTTLSFETLLAQVDWFLHLAKKSKQNQWKNAGNLKAWTKGFPRTTKRYFNMLELV